MNQKKRHNLKIWIENQWIISKSYQIYIKSEQDFHKVKDGSIAGNPWYIPYKEFFDKDWR